MRCRTSGAGGEVRTFWRPEEAIAIGELASVTSFNPMSISIFVFCVVIFRSACDAAHVSSDSSVRFYAVPL